jgi:hypothetical protein
MGILITILSIIVFWIIVGCISSDNEFTRIIGFLIGIIVLIVIIASTM